jgi:DNA-binding transcriptional ArsR family regulator
MPEEHPKITDPQRIRALAHPLRIDLLELLSTLGEATATECAECTGKSVASCSFHLRMLAKYGYVEPAEPRGREKPWRLVSRSRSVTADWDDPSSVAAAVEYATLTVEREFDQVRSWIRQAAAEPPEWVEATMITKSSLWLTREELAEISRRIVELAAPYKSRTADPAGRPEGSRLARLFATTTLDPGPEPAP